MVAWWWVLGALFGGAFIGALIISLCVAAGKAYRQAIEMARAQIDLTGDDEADDHVQTLKEAGHFEEEK